MAEETKPEVKEQKPQTVEAKEETPTTEEKKEVKTSETPKTEEKPKEDKKEEKKKDETPKVKKEEAITYGRSLRLSKKHGMYICSFIKNKSIDAAIKELEEVKKMKKAIPFKGEIPHRKGMMSGRYPVKGAGMFITMLKTLKGNAIVNGLELEKTVVFSASTSWARRPMRSNRRQGKRSNVILVARERKK